MAKMDSDDVYSLALPYAEVYGDKYGADPEELAQHIVAVAKKESGLNPKAKNNGSTARGIAQMLINTQREVEKKMAGVPFAIASKKSSAYPKAPVIPIDASDKIFDPDYALQLATAYLAYQYKRYGDWEIAVHAYNQGSYPGSHPGDGSNYASSVLDLIEEVPTAPLLTNTNVITNGDTSWVYRYFG